MADDRPRSFVIIMRADGIFGFLPPIESSLEIESIKRDPAKTL